MRMLLSAATSVCDPAALGRFAQLAQDGGLDYLVLDGPGDALIAASWLIAATCGIGLVPRIHATHTQPFHTARALAAMDTLSGGRIGWLPTGVAHVALSPAFGTAPVLPPSAAVDKAAEFVAAAQALWDSWDADALVIDKASAVYLDSSKIRRIDFRGEYFRVMGPLNAARPPQGHPLLVRDDSDPGFEQSLRSADVVLIGHAATGPAATGPAVAGTPHPLLARVAALRARTGARILVKVRCAPNADAGSSARQFVDWQHTLGCDGFHLECDGDEGSVAALLPTLMPELRQLGVSPLDRGGTLRARLGVPL